MNMHLEPDNWETQLQVTQDELAQVNFHLDRIQHYFQQYKTQAHQALGLAQTSQAQLNRLLALVQTYQVQMQRVQDELVQTQDRLQQVQKERDQYHTQLHLLQWELERTQFQLAIASQTLEPSQVQYKLLVWDAWYAYRNGNLSEMSECLHQAMKCTPFSKTKTVSNWLNSFGEFSFQKGEQLDINLLSQSTEWKQLIPRILGISKLSI